MPLAARGVTGPARHYPKELVQSDDTAAEEGSRPGVRKRPTPRGSQRPSRRLTLGGVSFCTSPAGCRWAFVDENLNSSVLCWLCQVRAFELGLGPKGKAAWEPVGLWKWPGSRGCRDGAGAGASCRWKACRPSPPGGSTMRGPQEQGWGSARVGEKLRIRCLCFEKHPWWEESDSYSSGFISPRVRAGGTRDPRRDCSLRRVCSVASRHCLSPGLSM